MHNNIDCPEGIPREFWQVIMKLPAFRCMKYPVDHVSELYEKYPHGNDNGTFCFVREENTFWRYYIRKRIWAPIGGYTAFEVWVQQPGNEGKTEEDFLVWLKKEALEAAEIALEAASLANEATENANTATTLANEATESANTAADRANTLADNPPKIENNYWWFYDEASGQYVNSGHVAKGDKGESPRVSDHQTWEVYNNETGEWDDTEIDCSSDYVLTKGKVEAVLTGFIDSHNHNPVNEIRYSTEQAGNIFGDKYLACDGSKVLESLYPDLKLPYSGVNRFGTGDLGSLLLAFERAVDGYIYFSGNVYTDLGLVSCFAKSPFGIFGDPGTIDVLSLLSDNQFEEALTNRPYSIYDNGIFYFIGTKRDPATGIILYGIYSTTDFVTFTQRINPFSNTSIFLFKFGNYFFATLSTSELIYRSLDFVNWELVDNPFSDKPSQQRAAYLYYMDNGKIVAKNTYNYASVSEDYGETWSYINGGNPITGTTSVLGIIKMLNGKYFCSVTSTNGGKILMSDDLSSFTLVYDSYYNVVDMVYLDGLYLFVGSSPTPGGGASCIKTGDLITFDSISLPSSMSFHYPELLLVHNEEFKIFTNDGVFWTPISDELLLPDIAGAYIKALQ
jgi:hypothetical protein